MDKFSGQKHAVGPLYPPITPFDQRMLEVGQGHVLYVEQCGNPDGMPVVVLHGGPGGGCSPMMRRYFDPSVYRIILFDQRGCGRSRPHASVDDNTTWHLVADIELIRQVLDIDRWAVFGGSWGATLSLIYAQAHPDRVSHIILRGVFLGTERELDWFYKGGAGAFWPDLWEQFSGLIPEAERDDIIEAYHKRLFSGDRAEEVRFGRSWAAWENALASVESCGFSGSGPADYARAFARIENHYFSNSCFISDGQEILNNMEKIRDIPGVIIQGRLDMICPPISAHFIAQSWPAARLIYVPNAGHAMSEPGITDELIRTMDRIARLSGRQ